MTFWDKTAWLYDIAESLNPKAYRGMLKGIAAVVPDGAKVLDCAAGTGELSIAAAEKAETVLCTDMSLPMLEMARKKCAEKGIYFISPTGTIHTAFQWLATFCICLKSRKKPSASCAA